jgi:hydroxyacylglutathione hydrolase
MLKILPFVLGPVSTNAYLIADNDTGEAAVIDPAADAPRLLEAARANGWTISQLWCTHAHFDHVGAVAGLAKSLSPAPLIGLHPADRPLWDSGGEGAAFGIRLAPASPPNLALAHGMELHLGGLSFEVRHAPGHTPGLCIIYCAAAGVCFCGDLIFLGSVGRTDLPGGDWHTLLTSIHEQVFSLPDETRLLSGHGGETTVGYEKRTNPYVNT